MSRLGGLVFTGRAGAGGGEGWTVTAPQGPHLRSQSSGRGHRQCQAWETRVHPRSGRTPGKPKPKLLTPSPTWPGRSRSVIHSRGPDPSPAHQKVSTPLRGRSPGLQGPGVGVVCVDRTPAPQARLADGHGYSPSLSKCWASGGSGREGGLWQRRRACHMSGAGVGGVWGPWWGACHPLPQATVLFSSSRLFAVPSPFSVASALEGPTAERLLKGEGQPLLLGGAPRPHTL